MASYTSSGSGNWSSASTWGGAGVPTDGDTVTIAAGHTVTYDANIASTGLAALAVNGTLQWSTDGTARTLLLASNVNVTGTGSLTIGTEASPIPAPSTSNPIVATLQFQGTGYLALTGAVTMWGECRDGRDTAAQAQLSTDSVVTLTTGGWGIRAGDVIRIGQQSAGENDTEHTVLSVAGNVVTLTAQLGRTVAVGDPIALISRNIRVLGANTANTRLFGSGTQSNVTVAGVEFRNWQNVLYSYRGDLDKVAPIQYCTAYNSSAYTFASTCTRITIDRCVFWQSRPCANYAFRLSRCIVFRAYMGGTGHVVTDCVLANTATAVLMFSGQLSRCTLYYCIDGLYGISGDTEIDDCQFVGCARDMRTAGNSSSYAFLGLVQLRNCLMGGGTEVLNYVNGNNAPDWLCVSRDHDQVSGAFKFWSAGGYGYKQSSVQRSGRSTLQFVAKSATWWNRVVWERTVEAGETLTIDVWCSALDEWDDAPRAILCHSTQEPLVDEDCTPLDIDVVDEFYSGSGDRTWHTGQLSWTNTGSDAAQVLLILAGRDASATCYWDWDIQSGGVAFPLGL